MCVRALVDTFASSNGRYPSGFVSANDVDLLHSPSHFVFVCLCSGNITFAEKAQNCEAGGGAGIIVYNNVAGPFSGTLGDNTSSITIPVMGISQEEGESLMDGFLGKQVSLTAMEGYSFLDGKNRTDEFDCLLSLDLYTYS